MAQKIEFEVLGTAVPQGSKTVFGGRAVDANAKRLKPWRAAVTAAARAAGGAPLEGPVRLRVHFFFERPKAHFRTGRFSHLLRDDAPEYVAVKPDIDKLVRALSDGITDAGTVWRDDSQVAVLVATQAYGARASVIVTVEAL